MSKHLPLAPEPGKHSSRSPEHVTPLEGRFPAASACALWGAKVSREALPVSQRKPKLHELSEVLECKFPCRRRRKGSGMISQEAMPGSDHSHPHRFKSNMP